MLSIRQAFAYLTDENTKNIISKYKSPDTTYDGNLGIVACKHGRCWFNETSPNVFAFATVDKHLFAMWCLNLHPVVIQTIAQDFKRKYIMLFIYLDRDYVQDIKSIMFQYMYDIYINPVLEGYD